MEMIDTLGISLQGELKVTIAGQQLRLIGKDKTIEVHFYHFNALQQMRTLLRTEEHQLPPWLVQLLQNTAFLDLCIFIDGHLVARSGPQAKPNFLGHSLGWDGLEIYTGAALTAFSGSNH
jgi:hypothetical protein